MSKELRTEDNTPLTAQEIEDRLISAAELIFPITSEMCVRKRTEARNKRVVFVWKAKKELLIVNSDKLKRIVLDELERKAADKHQV